MGHLPRVRGKISIDELKDELLDGATETLGIITERQAKDDFRLPGHGVSCQAATRKSLLIQLNLGGVDVIGGQSVRSKDGDEKSQASGSDWIDDDTSLPQLLFDVSLERRVRDRKVIAHDLKADPPKSL